MKLEAAPNSAAERELDQRHRRFLSLMPLLLCSVHVAWPNAWPVTGSGRRRKRKCRRLRLPQAKGLLTS